MLPLIIGGPAFIISSSTQVFFGLNTSSSRSCELLKNTCNATTADFNNFYNSTACVLFTVCKSSVFCLDKTLNLVGAPKSQPRMTESVSFPILFPFLDCFLWVFFLKAFLGVTGGAPVMTQQNYIDVYYHEISITPHGTYPEE